MLKMFLRLLFVVVVVTAGVLVFQNRKLFFRPTLARLGGTSVVFDLDGAADADDVERACQVLQKRFDPTGALGVVVLPLGDEQIDVRVPRGKKHDDTVLLVRQLAARRGKLEFRIVANEDEDAIAFTEARAALERAGKEARDGWERRGEPPPQPKSLIGLTTFHVKLAGELDSSYSWAEMSPDTVTNARLSGPAMDFSTRTRVDEAVLTGTPFLHEGNLLYVRQVSDPKRLPASARPSAGTPLEFFVLVRNPQPGQEVTGDSLERIALGGAGRGHTSIEFTLDVSSGTRLHELTSRNFSMRGARTGRWQHLAVLLDGQVFALVPLYQPMRRTGQISGNFSRLDAEELVIVVRGGSLPVKLTPAPSLITTIPPAR
jgi:preprotein translocase subunit SecD